MESKQYIALTGLNEGTLSVPEEVSNQREELAISAFAIKAVTTPIQAEQASYVLKEVVQFLSLIEGSRTVVKAPVLKLGKKIDAFASELTDKLDAEKKRISRLLGDYNAEQERQAAIAARRAQEEEQRIKDEANAKIAAAQTSSKTEAAFDRKATAIENKAIEQIVAVKAQATAITTPKQEGIATRTTTKFEVTDIAALYAARLELVKMEANTAAINALLRAAPNLTLPGLRTWKEAAAIVR